MEFLTGPDGERYLKTRGRKKMWGTFGGIAFAGFLALLFGRESRRHH
jgi:hypothetical protein